MTRLLKLGTNAGAIVRGSCGVGVSTALPSSTLPTTERPGPTEHERGRRICGAKLFGRDELDSDCEPLDVRSTPGAATLWWRGWSRVVDFKIGSVPLPINASLFALFAGFVMAGKVPSDILMGIVPLSMGGFTRTETGKHLPVLLHTGAASIFATFIPPCLAFYQYLPAAVVAAVTGFTKESNFLCLFDSSIIVGRILGMDRHVLIRGLLKITVPLGAKRRSDAGDRVEMVAGTRNRLDLLLSATCP